MKILIACGGTGGHIFPGLSLYNALKKKQSQINILLALDRRTTTSIIVTGDYPCVYLSLVPLKFKFDLQNALLGLKLLKGIFQSLLVLLKFRPCVVVGFGGYASFFLVFFAWIFRIKTVIYEPNVIPGLANWILAYLTKEIAIGFPPTKEYFGVNSRKVKFTGNPLRPNLIRIEKVAACGFLGLSADKFTILVMGGSQGSHKINMATLLAVSKILDKTNFQVIHLSGKTDYFFLESGYKDSGIKARVFSFFEPMEYAYSASDIVISRAGSASISEIVFFGLPSILIPYPYVRGHQIENAQYLCQNNAANMIKDENLNPEILKTKILELFDNPLLRESMSKSALKLSRLQADESLADLVLNV